MIFFQFAVTFNIPKFFEFKLVVNPSGEYIYVPTELNNQENYIAFCSWWDDLIIFGLVPFLSLLIFNVKIYMKVRSSNKMEYRFVGRKSLRRSTHEKHFSSSSGAKSSVGGGDAVGTNETAK